MNKQEQLNTLLAQASAFIKAGSLSQARFAEMALSLFAFQFQFNPLYQRFSRACGRTPDSVSSWQEIPAVVTSAFKEGEWSVLDPTDRSAVFHSSGTTGQQRSQHFHSGSSIAVYEQSLLQWFKPFVLPDLRRAEFCLLSPPPVQVPHSSLVHMFETVSNAFGKATYFGATDSDGAWQLDFERVAGTRFSGPVVICGTAFSFVHLCDWARENRRTVRFPAGSRVFETGGYKGRSRSVTKPELYALITETLGVSSSHIVTEYGMSELSSQAYDRRVGDAGPRHFQFPPWTRAQCISPETGLEVSEGQTGLIRVFDLANVASVMAIQTEDLGIRRGDKIEWVGRAAQVETRGCSLMLAS